MCGLVRILFFFSSRRRHTRYWRDWSSDVCSSDLPLVLGKKGSAWAVASETCAFDLQGIEYQRDIEPGEIEIGRASCRERVSRSLSTASRRKKMGESGETSTDGETRTPSYERPHPT